MLAIVDSGGANIASVNHGKKALRALRKAQRNLSRKKRGSANRRKAIRPNSRQAIRAIRAIKAVDATLAVRTNHSRTLAIDFQKKDWKREGKRKSWLNL